MRPEAERVASLLEAGYRPVEVAERLAMTRQRVSEMQKRLRVAIIQALADDGYSEVESIRYLGVPTQAVHANLRPAA